MAVNGRISVRHEDVFPELVLLLGVEPLEDFDKAREARLSGRQMDVQERDKDTGLRVWAVSVMDPSARAGQREVKVKVIAEQMPVPPTGLMQPVEFDGMAVAPYVDSQRCNGRSDKCRARQAFSYRATGFRPARPAQKSA